MSKPKKRTPPATSAKRAKASQTATEPHAPALEPSTENTTPAAPTTPEPKLSALDAAARVLKETGIAMTTKELIGAMAAKGYWSSPTGKTPSNTLYSALMREVNTKGEQSRFRKAGPGRFGLNNQPA